MSEKERGNPVLPKPPVPSQVRMSRMEEVVPKEKKEEEGKVEEEKGKKADIVVAGPIFVTEEKPKGTITIAVFENIPYQVTFSGHIKGDEVDMAWKAMMKAYRVWKHNLSKQEPEKDGGV